MHRKITSHDVESYASHLPAEEVELKKEEDIVYKKGVLTKASGTVSVKLMRKVNAITHDYAPIVQYPHAIKPSNNSQ